jgi:hypothetical protein
MLAAELKPRPLSVRYVDTEADDLGSL